MGVDREGAVVSPSYRRRIETPDHEKRAITEKHFLQMYEHAGSANLGQPEWWRAYLVFMFFTGWRMGALLALKWEDIEERDGQWSPLHPTVMEHILPMRSFGPNPVFRWEHSTRSICRQLDYIQRAAEIHVVCRRNHPHTKSCHTYSSHDFRRGFATINAENLTQDELQALMGHSSYQTTKKYYIMANKNRHAGAVTKLASPSLKPDSAG